MLGSKEEKSLYDLAIKHERVKPITDKMTERKTDLSTIKISQAGYELAVSLGMLEEGESFKDLTEDELRFIMNQAGKKAVSGEDITVASVTGMNEKKLKSILEDRGLEDKDIEKAVADIRTGNMSDFKQSIRDNIGSVEADETFQDLISGFDGGGRTLFNEPSTTDEALDRINSAVINTSIGTAIRTYTPSASAIESSYKERYDP